MVVVVDWYTLAAEQGLPDSQYMLALKYENGEGVDADYGQALYWYNEAAYGENTDAMIALGFYYEFGFAVDEDPVRALAWYMIAKDYGSEEAAGYVTDLSKELTEEQIAKARSIADDF